MNDKPTIKNTVKVRNGKDREGQLGRELGLVHRILYKLRAQGATEKDLAQLLEGSRPDFYEMVMAISRGFTKPEVPTDIINLDMEPGFPDYTKDKLTLIVDNRLGMHRVDFEAKTPWSILGIGDRALKISPTTGSCLSEVTGLKMEYHRQFLSPDKVIDLNKRGVEWFANREMLYHLTDNAGSDVKIFCLGTVWRQREPQLTTTTELGPISAMAVWYDSREGINMCERLPIPVGKWPDHCMIAYLE